VVYLDIGVLWVLAFRPCPSRVRGMIDAGVIRVLVLRRRTRSASQVLGFPTGLQITISLAGGGLANGD